MRLKPITPKDLSSEQHPLYNSIEEGIESFLKGFISKRADGALIGPFNSMLHFPQFGKPTWDFILGISFLRFQSIQHYRNQRMK